MRFRGKRIDSHDLRIDSDYHRGQFGHRMDRFWTGRIDSCDDFLLKKFSKCLESIRSVVESIHTCTEAFDLMKGCSKSIRLRLESILVLKLVLREVRESIRGLPESIHLCLKLGFNTQNCLRVDSSSLESILKRATGIKHDVGVSRANIPVLGVIYAIKEETPIIYMTKNVNVRGNERVVLGEVRTVVVRDMYWTGRAAKITDRRARREDRKIAIPGKGNRGITGLCVKPRVRELEMVCELHVATERKVKPE
ncbi:hypothetical protein PIB30_093075 [Stylosanthes scabra]|uniref:Uncharacterized protein n=1 Tax=Stylosanthes scabra TaxID=79078 RepID=A0ABU6TUM4_9FABA|nr:hypothetical protein [Stylosanthes scabra]